MACRRTQSSPRPMRSRPRYAAPPLPEEQAFQDFFGAFVGVAAPRHDLIRADEREICLVQVSRFFTLELDPLHVDPESPRCAGQSAARRFSEAKQRPLKTEEVE